MSSGITFVDVLVLRRTGEAFECLLLRRATGRSPGSWEMVHGKLDADEPPATAALRELKEETGYDPVSLYNLSGVESFYLHKTGAVTLVGMFAAFVDHGAVTLSEEHDAFAWLSLDEARRRFSWPREVRCLDDAMHLLGSGDAGRLEDALRIC